ncbi:MAG: ATP-binding protein [Flavobacteriaceae bacterium]|jgi:two-component system, OmpR family, phosphate regulon sensor histidine kinase PhoR|nr:ATP-binding protein [Flavobacteriaceae bacterium]MDG1962868.1 ATP-binding protein [Flavobacteriaceae bacterium]
MMRRFKKTFKFAYSTATWLTLLVLVVFFFFFLVIDYSNYWTLLPIAVIVYVGAFFLSDYKAKKLIYQQVNKIYQKVQQLDHAALNKEHIITNLDVLAKEVERFVDDKKLEITMLTDREVYRKEFMGNVAHELKTPLFTVQGYILTLLDGGMKDKTVRKKYLQRAQAGVERLLYIVNDLDMITKLEMGGLTLDKETFDLVPLIESSFDLLEMKAAEKGITLMLDKPYPNPIKVNADRERMQQVMTNLIENSIKYGKPKGTTEVSVQDFTKNKWLVRVTDNGEGIERHHFPRLFERFYRVDKSGSRKVGGSGLGLAIVKHLVEAHNEKIYIESQFGVGSEFSFTLENTK